MRLNSIVLFIALCNYFVVTLANQHIEYASKVAANFLMSSFDSHHSIKPASGVALGASGNLQLIMGCSGTGSTITVGNGNLGLCSQGVTMAGDAKTNLLYIITYQDNSCLMNISSVASISANKCFEGYRFGVSQANYTPTCDRQVSQFFNPTYLTFSIFNSTQCSIDEIVFTSCLPSNYCSRYSSSQSVLVKWYNTTSSTGVSVHSWDFTLYSQTNCVCLIAQQKGIKCNVCYEQIDSTSMGNRCSFLTNSSNNPLISFHVEQLPINRLVLPSSIQILDIDIVHQQPNSFLQLFTFGWLSSRHIDTLIIPSSLQSLTFGYHFNESIDKLQLPTSLKSLKFGYEFNQPVDKLMLPSSLQTLEFDTYFNQSVDQLVLPPSLQSLIFGNCFNHPINKLILPSSLQVLTFGYDFNQSIDKPILPSTLQYLTFGAEFNQSIEKLVLPSTLQSLTFGECFNKPIDKLLFPLSLQSLRFGKKFNQPIDYSRLPSSLQIFEIS